MNADPAVSASPAVDPVEEALWRQLAEGLAGAGCIGVSQVLVMPDGSGAFTADFPLPKDHWLYRRSPEGFGPNPPMGLRCGTADPRRDVLVPLVQAAARYAVQASTRCGMDNDYDPDALVQNMVVGLLGYWSPTGLSVDAWANPSPVPSFPALPKGSVVDARDVLDVAPTGAFAGWDLAQPGADFTAVYAPPCAEQATCA